MAVLVSYGSKNTMTSPCTLTSTRQPAGMEDCSVNVNMSYIGISMSTERLPRLSASNANNLRSNVKRKGVS